MPDPFIDSNETQSYGPFVRERILRDVKGLVPELDGAVDFCVEKQRLADEAMKAAIEADRSEKAIATARAKWLAVYNANKHVIEGVLRHAGKLALLSHVFDDLAETHHAPNVSDDSG
ncbi:MAG: hypothetical protein U0414_29920 [Polyangiaceae bacterium]